MENIRRPNLKLQSVLRFELPKESVKEDIRRPICGQCYAKYAICKKCKDFDSCGDPEREQGCKGFSYNGNGDVYDRFQWEALANIRPGGYADMDEAREAYEIFTLQIEQMARLAYNAFRRDEMHLEGKGTSGIVPEKRIIRFLVEKWEMKEEKAETLLAVMLHPKNHITERQGGGVVV